MSEPDAYIIGAGLAGLSCAVHAQKKGLKVKLFEATPKAGGRIRSFKSKHSGDEIDNGTHLVIKAYKHAFEYLKLIDRFEDYRPAKLDRFQFYKPEQNESWSVTPHNLLKSLYYGDIPGFGFKDLIGLWKIYVTDQNSQFKEKCLKNPQAIEKFWESLSLAIFNTPLQDLTIFQVRKLFTQLMKSGLDGFTPYFEETSLEVRFIKPALDRVQVEYGYRLKNVSNDGILHFTNGEIVETAQKPVILALPYASLKHLNGIGEFPVFKDSPITNIHYFFETGQNSNFIGLIGTLAQWVFVTKNRVSVTISASDQKPNDALAQKIWDEISFMFDQQSCSDFQIVSEKQATPLQDHQFIKFQRSFKPYQGKLIFAGDWTVSELPLTIESAILSGKKAAEKIKPQ